MNIRGNVDNGKENLMDKERTNEKKKQPEDNNANRREAQMGKHAVKSEGKIRVVVNGVVVWAPLERILERMAVETNCTIGQTMEVPVGRNVPQEQ